MGGSNIQAFLPRKPIYETWKIKGSCKAEINFALSMDIASRFAWFLLFVYVGCAENDDLEGSGEGLGELFTPGSIWQPSVMQEDDGNDVQEIKRTDSISFIQTF